MNELLKVLTSAGNETTGESGSTEKLTESLKGMVKSPIFYIVIGAIVLLIILVYLLRRIVKAQDNAKTIVVRKGQIYKVVDESNPKYFLTPFVDHLGAVISLNEKEISSDKLFINNGPDHLYQINFTLKYKVTNAEEFFKVMNNFEQKMVTDINDTLREYADKGNALVLVKDYRENARVILDLINKAVAPYSVETVSFKINLIQPLGR